MNDIAAALEIKTKWSKQQNEAKVWLEDSFILTSFSVSIGSLKSRLHSVQHKAQNCPCIMWELSWQQQKKKASK